MAPRLLLLPFLLFLLSSTTAAASNPAKKTLKEKLSHFHFYFHDVLSGRNATAVPVIKPVPGAQPFSLFGLITIIDDLLTERPDPKSPQLGRAQGFYAAADQQVIGFLMVMNLYFTAGKYNGSALSVLGRNPVRNSVRELPIVGGSGLFRFARGYAQAHTHFFDPATGDAVVEYNVSVLHY